MKKNILLIIFAVFSIMSNAQTYVSGEVSGVWTAENSPYIATDSLIIPQGDTLFINAGVKVIFEDFYKIKIFGVLIAEGSETDSIYFIPQDTLDGWDGLEFLEASGISKLKYCVIAYGQTVDAAYPSMHGGGVVLYNSDAIFENCLFYRNSAIGGDNGMGGAVYCMNTGSQDSALTKFINCRFKRNYAYGEGGAIKFSGDMNTEIFNCEFINNSCLYGGGAINFYNVYETKVIKTLFAKNFTEYSNGGAANTLGNSNTVYFTNCTFSDNEARHGDGGAMNIAYAQIYMTNTIIWNNPGYYSDDLNLDFEGYADINYSDLQMPDDATGANNFYEDPLFEDIQSNNYHITETSPCIDAGTDVGLPYAGNAPDVGYFEYGLDTISNDDTTTLVQNINLVNIYPNPTTNFVVIEKNNKTPIKAILYNSLGEKILETSINDQYKTINLKNLEQGMYFIEIQDNTGKIENYKILKQ